MPARRQFMSAWLHVGSMANPDAIRNDYATFLTTPNRMTVRKTMEALAVDVSGLLTVMRSDEGARTFHDAIGAIEGEGARRRGLLQCCPRANVPLGARTAPKARAERPNRVPACPLQASSSRAWATTRCARAGSRCGC